MARLAALRLALAMSGASIALAVAPPARATGGDRFVLAWPPTRYATAEVILYRDVAGPEPLRARVAARGLDVEVTVPATGAARVALPAGAACAPGLDACAIEIARTLGDAAFSVVLQSPDTLGAADTLLLTAHDTVRIPPASSAGLRHVVLSMPCAPASEAPMSASFATVVPVAGAASVRLAGAPCVGTTTATIAAGEALTVTCSATGDDLTGMVIEADAPVIVLSGNAVSTVPVDPGRGYSADLVMDLAAQAGVAGQASGPMRLVAIPLPRSAPLAGRGDLVRVVALESASLVVLDDRGGRRDVLLAEGERLDLSTAAPGADLLLVLESTGAIAAWHVPVSRALRGMGDPAAIPLVPDSRFTTRDRFFVPEGYGEANVLCIAAEPGVAVTLDGVPVGLAPAPGGALWQARVSLPVAGTGGSVHDIEGTGRFGAWVAGFGGYKAHGHAAAFAPPGPAAPAAWLRRGVRPVGLEPVAPASARSHVDAEPGSLLFWAVDDPGAILRASRCAGATCLAW